MTEDSADSSTELSTVRSTSMPRRTVVVERSRWTSCTERSSERPAPIMCQPSSRIMLAKTPCSDSTPVRMRPAVSATWWLCGFSCSASCARSTTPKARQVSAESWSRTSVRAVRSDSMECATDPTRSASVSSERNSASRSSNCRPASRPMTPSSTERLVPPTVPGRVRKSSEMEWVTSSSRSMSSARSAYRPTQKRSSSTRGTVTATARAAVIDITSARPWSASAGSALRTQTSLLAEERKPPSS